MKHENTDEITAVLPINVSPNDDETDQRTLTAERMRLSSDDDDERELSDDDTGEEENEDSEDSDDVGTQVSKLRVLGIVAGFAAGLVILATGVSWFFQMGMFAVAAEQKIDRSPKTTGQISNPSPVSEDEKLRMALEMVAEKVPVASPTPPASNVVSPKPESISPTAKTPDEPSLVLPGETVPSTPVTPAKPAVSSSSSTRTRSSTSQSGADYDLREPSFRQASPSPDPAVVRPEKPETPEPKPIVAPQPRPPVSVRSISFDEGSSVKPDFVRTDPLKKDSSTTAPPASVRLPFGLFLPVRILGAVYAVQNSGSLVRMELTQSVTLAGDVKLPVGTIFVGRVKGSELNRILVSLVGYIDPGTGGLTSFAGELVGGDGAAGVAGRRRSIKSGWSKVLSGLREAGGTAVGALAGLTRGGGTVLIADRATGTMTGELEDLVRRDRVKEYVEVEAGASAFVLVTELPRETVSDVPASVIK